MGPLIPNGILTDEWNIIIAVLIGLAFGFILEASGFSSSRKLGWIDMGMLYVHPTYVWAAIVGGAIMGVGFVAGGFCPGTSLCAVAIGKLDAWVYVFGILIGVFIFSEAYTVFEDLYNGSFLGYITLMDNFDIPAKWIILGVTAIAFFVSDIVRKRIKKVFY